MSKLVWTLDSGGYVATWEDVDAVALPADGWSPEGDVLTVQSDGSIAAEPGGGSVALPLNLGPDKFEISTTGATEILPDPDAAENYGLKVSVPDGWSPTLGYEPLVLIETGASKEEANGLAVVDEFAGNSFGLLVSPDGVIFQGLDPATANSPLWTFTVGSGYISVFVIDAHGALTVTTDDDSPPLILPNLPTADPQVAGALYSTAGVVHVSAG